MDKGRQAGVQIAHIPLAQPRTYKFVHAEICARLLGIPPIGEYDPWEARRQNLLIPSTEGSENEKKTKEKLKWKPPSNGQAPGKAK